MKKIVKEDLSIESFVLPRSEAIELMKEKDEPYKVELIEDLPEDEIISFYKQGEFVDLCAGPHLMSTKPVKAFKLTKLALSLIHIYSMFFIESYCREIDSTSRYY